MLGESPLLDSVFCTSEGDSGVFEEAEPFADPTRLVESVAFVLDGSFAVLPVFVSEVRAALEPVCFVVVVGLIGE